MKFRESGMPEEAYWETLLDVPLVLDRLGIDQSLRDVAELGCGYGTFSLPVAQRITGTLYTCDIDPAMVQRTTERARSAGVTNLQCEVRDVFSAGLGRSSQSQDACLLFNILHCEEPQRLLNEAVRVVRPGGVVLVIHWRYDPCTPRGPAMAIRPRPEELVLRGEQSGLRVEDPPAIPLPPWHYGIRFLRVPPG